MSTGAPQDQPPQDPNLTMEQAQGLGTAGAQGAATAHQSGQTPEQIQAAAATSVRDQAQRDGVRLDDAQVQAIAQMSASMVIAQLEDRGAFDQPPAPPPAQAGSTAPPPAGQAPAPGQQPAGTGEGAPHKRTVAEWFQGK